VVHTKTQILAAAEMTTEASGWNSLTRFVNLVPAATSGFWHIVMPASLKHNSSLILSSKETVIDDIPLGNLIILVPALIDQMRIHYKNYKIDFSNYNAVMVGASPVLDRHAEWCFSKNTPQFIHLYGMTETCSPVLCKSSIKFTEWTTALDLLPLGDTQVKIEDSELWVKGSSLAEGLPEWFNTGDMWAQTENLIKFVSRANDCVKLNGYMANLLLIENEFEKEEFNLGEVLAVPRNSLGTDWIELYYTNQTAIIDKEKFAEKTEHILLACSIPKKYSWVETIKKNNYGKKLRNS
jgi:acyl-CoA synthetase (AMP-forming)/AMP-acid ligase II